jgi:hypothetical protein
MMSDAEARITLYGHSLSDDAVVKSAYAVCMAEGGFQALPQDWANYHPEKKTEIVGTKYGVAFRYFYGNVVPKYPELKVILDDIGTARLLWKHLPLPVCASYAYWTYGRIAGVKDVTTFYVAYYRPALVRDQSAWEKLEIFKKRGGGQSQIDKASAFMEVLRGEQVPLLTMESVVGHIKMLAAFADKLSDISTIDKGANGIYSPLDGLYGRVLYDRLIA